MSACESKRLRGKNFTDWEKDLLVDLILPFKSIIENIKTDAVWNQRKYEAWIQILNQYNAHQTSGVRTVLQLKHLYDTQKRLARKEKSDDKVEVCKTGGGTRVSRGMSNTTQKIIGLLGDRMDPLTNYIDSDTMYNNSQDLFVDDEIFVEEISAEELIHDTSNDTVTSPVTPSILESRSVDNLTRYIPIPESRSVDKSTPYIPIPATTNVTSKPAKTSASNYPPNSASFSTPPVNSYSPLTSKKNSSNKVYEGLSLLNEKRLAKSDIDTEFKKEIHEFKLEKAKIDCEISEIEKTLVIKRMKFEEEKMESETRQNKIKEELLLLELKHKKKMLGIE